VEAGRGRTGWKADTARAGYFMVPLPFSPILLPPLEVDMIKFLSLIKDEKGATAIEYGLIAALIAVAAIGAMTSIGTKLGTTFNNVANSL